MSIGFGLFAKVSHAPPGSPLDEKKLGYTLTTATTHCWQCLECGKTGSLECVGRCRKEKKHS